MTQNANSINPGNVIEHKNKLWRVIKTAHTMPGKGGAFVQMELKDVSSGTKLNERFRSSENIERIRLDQEDFQYLYGDSDTITLMDMTTYEQKEVSIELFGDLAIYLQDGMKVIIESHEGKPLGITLPDTVTLEVTETEAVVKGQTAANSNKPAILDNGVKTMVPPFIEVGEKVIVKTEDGSYVERAK
jgi:elongation factor P